jgi:hypothetical protein
MKAKQIVLLLVLVAVIGAIGFFVQKRSQSQWSESAAPGGGKLLDFPINDVARVVIRSANGQVNIAKKNNLWVVKEKADYPANFERVSRLIRQLWELHPVQELTVGPSQLARLELVQPGQSDNASPASLAPTGNGHSSGTLVELKDKDGKTLAQLIAGKQNVRRGEGPRQFPMPMGRYVLASARDGGRQVALVNQMVDVDTKPESWVRRDFVKISNPSSITLSGQTPAKHWTLTRADEKAEWKLADARPNESPEKPVTASLATLLSSSMFTDVLPPDAKPEAHGLDKPDLLTIQTFDGFTYVLKIGKAEANNYPVAVSLNTNLAKERTPAPDEKPEDKAKKDEQFNRRRKELEEKAASEKELEKRIYLVPKYTLDPFLKDRAALLAKPTATPSPSPSTTLRKKR